LKESREIFRKIKSEIEIRETSLEKYLEESEVLRVNLLDHYNKLLKEGKDTRYIKLDFLDI